MQNQAIIQATEKRYENFVNPTIVKMLKLLGSSTVEWQASGIYIFTASGEKYLDCLGGYGVFSLGHRHAEVIAAVREQLDYMPLASNIFLNDKLAQLSEKLAEIMPGMGCSFIVNSGAEAVEGALKLARIHTGRNKIIAMENAFHGQTFGALSATGRAAFRIPFAPLVPDFVHVAFNDLPSLAAAIDEHTAAVILEPIQGEGGIIVPAPGYLMQVAALCKKSGCLLICDEVQTGLGRTGKMFAVEYDGIMPDIMLTAKALGGGVMPIGAITAQAAVWDRYQANPFLHTSTFGGNQLACAAALATINVLQRDYDTLSVSTKGKFFLHGLQKLQLEYPQLIAAVRGRGLMLGVVFQAELISEFFMAECIKQHILVAYTLNNPRVIRLEPPFLISFALISQILEVFAAALQRVAAAVLAVEERMSEN